MKAQIGDQVIVASAQTGAPARTGTIVELRHPDGTPPYVVRWSDSGSECVYFPGPDGHTVASVITRIALSHALIPDNDPDQFAREIHRGGYATSPTYADNLIALMRSRSAKSS